MSNKIINKSLGTLLALTALSGAILSSPKASADTSANVNISVTVPSVCSLAASPESVSNTIYPGHDDTIGTTNIKAICNDPAGLAVYAVGYTDSTYGNTDLISTVGGTTNVIHTNVTTSGTPSASEWYMTLTAVSGDYIPTIVTNFDSAHEIPDVYTKVAYRNSVTDMGTNATGANFTAAFDAYIAENQAAGTYTGKVKFLLVHPSTHDAPITPVAVAHQICYYGNEEDEGSMACQDASANSEVDLRAPNFSRAGYGFAGWNTKDDGTGINYGPNETITITQDMYDNGLALFANWVAAETGATMQTFDDTASPYSTAPNGTVIALRDARDGDVYAVAKLADGRWWTIENLRLDYDADITTSNTRSNNSSWGGVFAGLAEPESSNFADVTAANSLYSYADITGDYKSSRFPRYNNSNTASRAANPTSGNTNIYSYGNYYTWAAATADTGYYDANNLNQSVTATSLCPTGWHLPTGGNADNLSNSEWWLLSRAVIGSDDPTYTEGSDYPYYADDFEEEGNTEGTDASKALRTYPTNLIYSGFYGGSVSAGRGSYAGYWSSTIHSSTKAFFVTMTRYVLGPGASTNYKYLGHVVRCIAD